MVKSSLTSGVRIPDNESSIATSTSVIAYLQPAAPARTCVASSNGSAAQLLYLSTPTVANKKPNDDLMPNLVVFAKALLSDAVL